MAACLMILGATEWAAGKNSAGLMVATPEVIVRRPVITAALCLALVLCGLLTWRASGVMRAQYLQGEADLQFNPRNPANNEAWRLNYLKALGHDPYSAGAHFGCGFLLYQMKRPEEATSHLEVARRLVDHHVGSDG